ncbi:reverse transcriptase domain-containing protein [Citrus sinensis]|nr:reverse transcriptase domain-containing protein [Citrus sinensis]
MNCITTSSFSVIINGKPKGMIYLQRGLRHGCPVSPYLFILCAEAFSNMLLQVEQNHLIQMLKFRKEITISHLLFADDNLVFTKASVNNCKNLKTISDCYVTASGQLFNYDKSSLVFSGKIPVDKVDAIKNIFQLNVVSRHEKYLGLPSMVGSNKISFFNEVKLKVVSKIANWQRRFFSSGGKEILIKVVAQAIPAYAMSVFKLPIRLCMDIQKAMAEFWWRSKEDKCRIHWARWEKISHAKSRGGLSFKEMSSFNQALMAKEWWRLL